VEVSPLAPSKQTSREEATKESTLVRTAKAIGTRLYTGADGQAHAGRIEISMMPSGTLAGLEGSEMFKVSGAQFVRLPPGHVCDWHNAEQCQYVVTLSGRGEVEVSGRQRPCSIPARSF
jgi:quercetin dioxygenase-like cupin family protein